MFRIRLFQLKKVFQRKKINSFKRMEVAKTNRKTIFIDAARISSFLHKY